MRAASKYFTKRLGAQFAMTAGIWRRQGWCVANLALGKLSAQLLEAQLLEAPRAMGAVTGEYGSTSWNAVAMSRLFSNAHLLGGESTIVTTARMPVPSAPRRLRHMLPFLPHFHRCRHRQHRSILPQHLRRLRRGVLQPHCGSSMAPASRRAPYLAE